MSWSSFWVGVAAIPTLAIATALICIALAWLAKGIAWAVCKSARLRAHTDASREAYAAVILATTGNFVTLTLGSRIVIMFDVKGKTDTSQVKEVWEELRDARVKKMFPGLVDMDRRSDI